MKKSNWLFINLIGFSLNFTALTLTLMIRAYTLSIIHLMFMVIAYSCIKSLMDDLDKSEE